MNSAFSLILENPYISMLSLHFISPLLTSMSRTQRVLR